jgi:hypothetical protein
MTCRIRDENSDPAKKGPGPDPEHKISCGTFLEPCILTSEKQNKAKELQKMFN